MIKDRSCIIYRGLCSWLDDCKSQNSDKHSFISISQSCICFFQTMMLLIMLLPFSSLRFWGYFLFLTPLNPDYDLSQLTDFCQFLDCYSDVDCVEGVRTSLPPKPQTYYYARQFPPSLLIKASGSLLIAPLTSTIIIIIIARCHHQHHHPSPPPIHHIVLYLSISLALLTA